MEGEAELDVTQGCHTNGVTVIKMRTPWESFWWEADRVEPWQCAAACVTENTYSIVCIENEFLDWII